MNFTCDNTSDRCENWRIWLAEFVGKQTRALEIGAYEGRSSVWFAENILTHPDSRLVCIDQWRPIEPYTSRRTDFEAIYRRFWENTAAYKNISAIRGCSHEILRYTQQAFDFAYIDGSHWPIDVLKDAVLTFDLVCRCGIIIFDDYGWHYNGPLTEPKIAIDAFLSVYEGKYELIDIGYQVAIRKL